MKIVIVGGGSSGWLVASGLIRYFPKYNISLIESPTIPTIGVGESTTAYVKHFIKDCLKINEYDFLKYTDGIYKMSVKFKNFSNIKNNSYYYPFGMPYTNGFDNFYISAWDLIKKNNKNIIENDFVKFMYPAYHLFSKNKINENLNNEFDNFNFNTDLGYHFDANKVGDYLKKTYCIPKGVNHISNNVKDVVFLNEEIEYLILENDEKIYADLFIDCSGFKSILLGQKMKPKFINISHKLINNKAWAVPIKYKNIEKQMQPYTTATAIENGWCWYTPISSRIGNGYAYSDKFIDSEMALEQFKNYIYNNKNYSLTRQEINELPFFEINMKTGYYEESMIKNVVAIGMSSGFLEPLEGTGLHFIIESIYSLIKIIKNNKTNQFLIDSFNLKIKEMYETWTDTLLFIYLSSQKKENEYWKYIYNLKTIDLDLKNKNHIHDINDYAYRIHGWTRHNYVNDLFNNILRGSGIIDNLTDMDIDIYEMYNRNDIHIKNLNKKYLEIFNYNIKKWEFNSNKSLHIYNFLLEKNAIL